VTAIPALAEALEHDGPALVHVPAARRPDQTMNAQLKLSREVAQ
jgi:hypothetical protein